MVRISCTNARRSKSQGGKKTLADVQRQLAEGTDLQGLYAPARTTSLTDTFDRNRDNTTIVFTRWVRPSVLSWGNTRP